MCLCKNKIKVCLIYLTYTPVFAIKKKNCRSFYFEKVLFNALGSFRHTYAISYSICICTGDCCMGLLISQILNRAGRIWSLDDPYTLLKYCFFLKSARQQPLPSARSVLHLSEGCLDFSSLYLFSFLFQHLLTPFSFLSSVCEFFKDNNVF